MRKKGTHKNCQFCHNRYYVSPSLAAKSKFCCRACMIAAKAVERKELQCDNCGKKFVDVKDHGVWPRFCSRACFCANAPQERDKECPICGALFTANRSSHGTDGLQKYCSNSCRSEGLRRPNYFVCECCGKEFVRSDSMIHENRFCSRKCMVETTRKNNSHAWKGGKYKNDKQSTVMVLVKSREGANSREIYIGEHRIIAAKHIGRPLERWEPVLHLNQRNDDNSPDNIFVCESIREMRQRYSGTLPWPEKGNLDTYGR